MKIKLRNAALGLGMVSCIMAFGWGQKGHDTVAYIAECHLTPEAKAAIDTLLQGKSIVYWANWLDNASNTPEFAYTKTWHYKNIDEGETFATARLNPKGDAVRAVQQESLVLADKSMPDSLRSLALKILVHIVGDLHQPMHLGRASDRGGNQHKVNYFKSPRNLHSIWDSNLVESAHKWSYTEWQQNIDRADSLTVERIVSVMEPAQWGEETYEIAKRIYASTPEDCNVEYKYIADWTPVIEGQLLKGGLRLANLLNGLLK